MLESVLRHCDGTKITREHVEQLTVIAEGATRTLVQHNAADRAQSFFADKTAPDTKIEVPQGQPQQAAATRQAVVDAMDGHVLGKAVLVARFHR